MSIGELYHKVAITHNDAIVINTMTRTPRSPYSSNSASDTRAETTYAPRQNRGLVRLYESGELTPEYEKILPYRDAHPLLPGREPLEHYRGPSRKLSIVSDTFINFEGHPLELIGDARFIFNALAAVRYAKQSTMDIVNFRSGFRGEHHESTKHNNVATHLLRAIQALDAAALEVSGDILVDRTTWGSGQVSHYFIKSDVKIQDKR